MIIVPPSREIVLSTVAQALYSGGNPVLRIRDVSLIEPSIQTIRELVQRARREEKVEGGKEPKPPFKFLEMDFRKGDPKKYLEEVEEAIGSRWIYHDSYGGNVMVADNNILANGHIENTRLVFINPLDGNIHSDELHFLTLYVKYDMKALVLLPEEPVSLPAQASKLVGEHCGWMNYLDYAPPSYHPMS